VLRPRADRCFERFRRTGDPRHLAAAFDRTAPELWRVAAHLCQHRHDAEDAVQSTFLAAIEHRADWDAARALLPWLLGLLVNRVREQHRREARSIDTGRLAPERAEDPAERAAHGEFGVAFAASLRQLDEPLRSTLEQHLVHGKRAHEIAAQDGVSAGAVRMRIHRGLDQLRRNLPRAGFASGAIAMQMPPTSFASVRAAVLANVPGGTAVPATAILSAFAIMTTSHWLFAGATIAAVVAFALLRPSTTSVEAPVDAHAPVAAAPASTTAPNIADTPAAGSAAPAASTRVAAAPAAATGTLRVSVRTAWNDEPIGSTSVRIAYGMHPLASAPRTEPGSANAPAAAPPDVAAGIERARTDAAGIVRVVLPVGRARISLLAYATCPNVDADVHADRETECIVRVPASFTGAVRVVGPDDLPVAGARVFGRAVTDSGMAEREFGVTDAAGRWSGPFAGAYVFVRAAARGRAASAPVALQKAHTEVTLRIGGDAAVVHGTVSGADGAPVADAEVLLHAREVRASEIAPLAVRTSPTGTFVCDCVPPGPCLVLAVRGGEIGQLRFTLQDVTTTAISPTHVDLRFPAGARLSTKLRRQNGDPGGHGNITLVPRHRELPPRLATFFMAGADTDARGECVIDGLFAGPYELRVPSTARNAPPTVELRDGETHELVVTLAAETWIEVEVVDDAGAPVSGWLVALDGDTLRKAITLPANGRARFEGIAPGAHEVALLRHRHGFPLLTSAAPVDQRTRLVVPRAAMALRTLRGSVGPADGVELSDLRVTLMRAASRAVWAPTAQITATISPVSRTFAFDALPAGTYDLMVGTRLSPMAMRMGLQVGASDVDIGTIALGTGGIDLHLVRSDGLPVNEPFVGIDMGGDRFTTGGSTDGLVPRELPAATYRLLAWGRDVEPVIVPVTVRIGERTPVPITLRPATATTITFAGATVRRGSLAQLKLDRDRVPFLSLLADVSEPLVRGLTPGSYRIEVEAADGTRGSAEFRVTAATAEPVIVRIER
jgi:RNA polymerase sigma factor (sigma-70 family)